MIYGRICEHRRDDRGPGPLRLVCRLDVNSLTPRRPDKAKVSSLAFFVVGREAARVTSSRFIQDFVALKRPVQILSFAEPTGSDRVKRVTHASHCLENIWQDDWIRPSNRRYALGLIQYGYGHRVPKSVLYISLCHPQTHMTKLTLQGTPEAANVSRNDSIKAVRNLCYSETSSQTVPDLHI